MKRASRRGFSQALGLAALTPFAPPVFVHAAASTSPLHRLEPTRGLAHAITDPRRTAVIVVDMQNFFIEPGQPRAGAYAVGIIPNIRALVDAVRANGGVVAWTRHTGSDRPGEATPAWFDAFIGPDLAEQVRTRLRPGQPAHAIHPALDVRDDDIVLDKFRFSAFLPTDLHERLQQRGVDTLIVTGTVTNYCCQATARDGMLLDYRVVMPPDATAAANDAVHNATYADLSNMGLFDLRTTPAVLAALRNA